MSILNDVICDNSRLDSLTEPEWEDLLRFGRYAKMLATVREWVWDRQLQDKIPYHAKQVLDGEKVRHDYLQLHATRELEHLTETLSDVNYPVVLLKGAAYMAASLAPARGRRLSDVDILVPKPYIEDTETRLKNAGWQQDASLNKYDDRYYRDWSQELPPLKHPARGLEIDLHHNLVAPTSRIKLDALKLFPDCQKLENSNFYILSPADRFLHSATHLLFNDELRGGLRDLADMRLLCMQEPVDSEFWINLPKRAAVLNLGRPLHYALTALKNIFQVQVPADCLQAVKSFAPNPIVDVIMQKLIIRALAPQNVNRQYEPLVHRLIYVRAHWVRMPPIMLTKHLLYKAWTRFTENNQFDQKTT